MGSNNTNNYNPQEPSRICASSPFRSNNTNNYNPQERITDPYGMWNSSNNTNNYNPQEQIDKLLKIIIVQIIPITTILKNETLLM